MAAMRSPLPDSSNLEAGIVEDALPPRRSRIHDNVRDLLRRSIFGSVAASPVVSPTRSLGDRVVPSPRIYPAAQHSFQQTTPISPAVASTISSPHDVPGVLFPAWRSQPDISPVVDDAGFRFSDPRPHPDLNQDAMAVFLQQKELQRHRQRQNKAWKRHRSRKPRPSVGGVQWVICSILGFAVLGLLGTYIALVATSSNVSALLHVLFVLALLLTSIVFVHTLIRLCCLSARNQNKKRIVRIEPAPRRRHPRRQNHQETPPIIPTPTNASAASAHYVPPTPIPVQSHEFGPPDAPNAPEMCEISDDKGPPAVPNPPPAYGSTASSVRADPELLFWHAIPSPVVEDSMPSPTYESVMREEEEGVGAQRSGERDRP